MKCERVIVARGFEPLNAVLSDAAIRAECTAFLMSLCGSSGEATCATERYSTRLIGCVAGPFVDSGGQPPLHVVGHAHHHRRRHTGEPSAVTVFCSLRRARIW